MLNSTLVRLRQLGGCKLHAFIGRTTAGDAVVLEHAAVELESSTKELLRAWAGLVSRGLSTVTLSLDSFFPVLGAGRPSSIVKAFGLF